MGLNVSTGLTYLQQPGLKQLFTCVWQQTGALIKTQALDILNTLYFCFYYEIVIDHFFAFTGQDGIWSHLILAYGLY